MRRTWVLATLLLVGLGVAGQQASALDVSTVEIVCGADRTDGTINEWFFQISVLGAGLTDGAFWNSHLSSTAPGTEWQVFTPTAGGLIYRNTYGSQAAMEADYPNANDYDLWLNYVGPGALDFEDQVLLGFSAVAPGGFATITYPLHGAVGVEPDPLYAWNDVSGVCNALGLGVYDGSGTAVYDVWPEPDETRTTWQPGTLLPNSPYSIAVATTNLMAGDYQILNTDGSSDAFTAIRGYVDVNTNSFRTGVGEEVPEPGTWALVGTSVLTIVGLRRRRRIK